MSLSDFYRTSTGPAPSSHLQPELPHAWHRVRQWPAWLLPAALILAFAGVFAVAFKDQLIPALPVQVRPAILLADIDAADAAAPTPPSAGPAADEGREMLFQAGGWVEPDPLPVYAVALTDGVISKVHVLEGEEVKRDQVLAELIDEDAKIALLGAERAHAQSVAALELQHKETAVKKAEAEAMLDLVRVAEAKLAEEEDNLARLVQIEVGSVSDQERIRAKFVVQGQKAEVAARRSQHEASLARITAAESQAAVLQAAEKLALVAVAKQKLMLDRTKIVSPVDGVVLALFAAPGEKKILAMDDHKSAVVASLFQKGKLQVRVDVPLSEARQLVVGQPAVITTDYLPGVEFGGIVSRIVGSADLQRNTLQAKVRVLEPDPRLRPEMLCRVRFMEMAPSLSTSAGGDVPGSAPAPSDSRRAIMVPESALVAVAQDTRKQATLWVVSPDGKSALSRPVVPGAYRQEGYLSIRSGLLAGERVILPPHDGLRDGRRLKIESVAP